MKTPKTKPVSPAIEHVSIVVKLPAIVLTLPAPGTQQAAR